MLGKMTAVSSCILCMLQNWVGGRPILLKRGVAMHGASSVVVGFVAWKILDFSVASENDQ